MVFNLGYWSVGAVYPAGAAGQFGQAPANQAEQQEVDTEMGPSVLIMKPILRFLQLLCENHNQDLQVSYCSCSFSSRSTCMTDVQSF